MSVCPSVRPYPCVRVRLRAYASVFPSRSSVRLRQTSRAALFIDIDNSNNSNRQELSASPLIHILWYDTVICDICSHTFIYITIIFSRTKFRLHSSPCTIEKSNDHGTMKPNYLRCRSNRQSISGICPQWPHRLGIVIRIMSMKLLSTRTERNNSYRSILYVRTENFI